jgi:hypothetical protein
MPEAANSLQKRKRGGQPGNRNRLVHGRYTQAEAASRADIRTIRRKGRALVILVDNVLKARKALKHRLAARALAPKSATARPQRPVSLRRKVPRAPLDLPLGCHGPPSSSVREQQAFGNAANTSALSDVMACENRPSR